MGETVCGCRHFCIFEIFCELPPTIPEGLASRSSEARLSSLFLFSVLGYLVNRASFLLPDRHFALVAGLEDVFDESCGSDVEDELVPVFDDNPGDNKRNQNFRLP